MTAAPIKIKRAITSIIAGLPAPIVPTTTLNGAASIGDTTVHIAPLLDTLSRSRILAGSRLGFHDATAEKLIPIESVSTDGATVTLKTPLQFAHAATTTTQAGTAATRVYANLLDYSPEVAAIGRMLVLDDPVVSMYVGRKRSSTDPGGGPIFPTFEVEIYYARRFSKPSDDPREPDIYSRDQEDADYEDTTTIEKALLADQTLISDFQEAPAIKFAALGSSNDLVVTTWDYRPVEGNVWEFIATLELRITGLPPSIA